MRYNEFVNSRDNKLIIKILNIGVKYHVEKLSFQNS